MVMDVSLRDTRVGNEKVDGVDLTRRIRGLAAGANLPVILLTDYSTERTLLRALNAIQALSSIKGKPVAIRMETLW